MRPTENRGWPRTEEVRPGEVIARASGLFFSIVSHASVSLRLFSLPSRQMHARLFPLICLTNCSHSYQTFPSFSFFLSPPFPPPPSTSANRKTNLGFSSSLSLLFASAWSRNFQGHANASFSEKLCRVGERLGRELPAKGYRRDYVFLSKRLESRTIRPTCKIPILSKIRRARFYSRNCHIPLSLLAAS